MKKYLSPALFFIFVLVLNLFIINTKGIANLDFVWTFGFPHSIRDGYLPYLDFNTIIYPLFCTVMSPFAENMTTYCIFSSVIFAGLGTIIFSWMKKLRWVLPILFAIKLLGVQFFEYNTLMLLFILFSCMTLKTYFKKLSPKYLFFTGLLLSLGLITKHNVPAFAIIFTTAVVTVYTMKNKKYKDFLLYAIGGLIPAIIVVLASFYFGFFKEMVNFTILGVTNFYSITNTHDSLIAIYILLIFIIFAAALLKSKIDIKELCYISGYAIAGLQVVKMEDLFHIICGLLYFVVLFLIVLQDSDFEIKNFIENIKNKKINLKHCVYIMSVIALLISMLLVGIHSFFNYQYMKERSIYKIDSEMYGELKVDKLFYDVITSTTEYIDSHPEDKVVVISEFAKAVSLYYDIHWGVMDMNLIYDGGVNGEEKIIRDMYNYDKLISLQTDAIASNDNLYKYMEDHFEVCDEIIINDKSYYVYQVSGEYQEK